jgi:hypothetical protein
VIEPAGAPVPRNQLRNAIPAEHGWVERALRYRWENPRRAAECLGLQANVERYHTCHAVRGDKKQAAMRFVL